MYLNGDLCIWQLRVVNKNLFGTWSPQTCDVCIQSTARCNNWSFKHDWTPFGFVCYFEIKFTPSWWVSLENQIEAVSFWSIMQPQNDTEIKLMAAVKWKTFYFQAMKISGFWLHANFILQLNKMEMSICNGSGMIQIQWLPNNFAGKCTIA